MPIFSYHGSIFTQECLHFNSLIDLKGFSLGVTKKSPFIPIYQKHNLEYNEVETPMQLFNKTLLNREDFFEATFLTGYLLGGKKEKSIQDDLRAVVWILIIKI
ncbi:MAG: hypothetical protein OCC49_01030 [Fibrobacterales bacterium]